MNNRYFIIVSFLSVFYVCHEVRKKKLSIKESFWWFIASLVMVVLSIWPYSINKIAAKLRINYAPSLLFLICIVFLLFISFKNSKKIAEQNEKIIELAQELAIIKENNRNKDNKNEK